MTSSEELSRMNSFFRDRIYHATAGTAYRMCTSRTHSMSQMSEILSIIPSPAQMAMSGPFDNEPFPDLE